MPTNWNTFPIEFKGGLISNMSQLQHGLNEIGSATTLQNFEPSRKGGYAKIAGYSKFSTVQVPGDKEVLAVKAISRNKVVAARKITSTVIADHDTAQETRVVSGDFTDKTVIRLTTSVHNIELGMSFSSPANSISLSERIKVVAIDGRNITLSKAVTVTNSSSVIFHQKLDRFDNGKTGYFVLNIDAETPFWQFLQESTLTSGGRVRSAEFNLDGPDKVVFVDGNSYPIIYDSSNDSAISLNSSDSADVAAATDVAIFKNTAFYAVGNKLVFTAPDTIDDFATANGAGIINVDFTITGLSVFRDQLIIFTAGTIKRLTGNTSSDFQLTPITEKIGCIDGRSIQEFGGDIMYLAADGLRLLSATDRIGDFALDVASDKIYRTAVEFLDITEARFESVIIRSKSQYRIFSYKDGFDRTTSEGLMATKYIAQGGTGVAWGTTLGIRVFVADGIYENERETILFANEDGYIYKMEDGVSFDGSNIPSIYQSPNLPITDPQVRKTIYKAALYIQPTGLMTLDISLKYDFEQLLEAGSLSSFGSPVQPAPVSVTSGGANTYFYGGSNATYGNAIFVNVIDTVYAKNMIGSCRTVAIRVENDSKDPTFTLDAAVLEYAEADRQ